MKDNEASEYYANYCIKSWEAFGLEVKRFDAIVPKDLQNLNELKWEKYSSSIKYLKLNINVEFTDTEKGCFYSHYMLWKKCIEKQKPIMVLEHDAYLEKPENLWFDPEYGIIFFDKAATGSYVIFPWFAEKIVNFLARNTIKIGPYATIENIAIVEKIREKVVNVKHSMYKAASNQVMSDQYGNTIEHFCNSNRDLFNKKAFHKFKKI
jgi:hypothetical protein